MSVLLQSGLWQLIQSISLHGFVVGYSQAAQHLDVMVLDTGLVRRDRVRPYQLRSNNGCAGFRPK